jgi:NitT/TauT family transport system substrate-binding protein
MAYHRIVYAVAALVAFSVLGLVRLAWGEPVTLRVGHFPNITHVQALVAHGLSRQGRGWFEEHLGPDVKIQWFVYNAGPSAMEALFADSIDLTYVGPSPAINAYAKARGDDIRIVAGAVEGGAALVVQPDSGLRGPVDFRGKSSAPRSSETHRTWRRALGSLRAV